MHEIKLIVQLYARDTRVRQLSTPNFCMLPGEHQDGLLRRESFTQLQNKVRSVQR